MKKILDWNKYLETAAKAVAEGIVMLKNDNNALPLDSEEEISVFGRIQLNYYKSGTGSGGMVNVSKVTGIVDGLIEAGVKINEELLETYRKWSENNPFDLGEGWGSEPWSQKEMPLDSEIVKKAAVKSSTAIVIIGRTAGEEMDAKLEEGSYLLTADELDMLEKVRKEFKKMVVLLNVGGLVDMSFVDKYAPDSVLYVWQGGMTGGTGTAAVLTGKTSPSGKLPDTIAYNVSDYPSDPYFGDKERNFYKEDIFVGYRWFETFAKDKVRYPFGYGLSYTTFDIKPINTTGNGIEVTLSVNVTNTGKYSGKEVVQVYCEAPQGKLGKAARILCGFEKTKELAPGESQELEIKIQLSDLMSYDDSGVSGNLSCWVMEAGDYTFYVGNDVRTAVPALTVTQPNTAVWKKCVQALAPVLPFERIRAVGSGNDLTYKTEHVPLNKADESQRRIYRLPKEIPYTGDKGIKLIDVKNKKNNMNEFIAQLSDYDLECIIRGEGMGSPRVTAGTASAFGGVTDELSALGIPAGCCSDGPSGMRLDCGTKAFSLPNGTMIASTFNKELITELFEFMGTEMTANNVDCLLGPGMNIHRHPLNGRNFEYFSEDPFLTGSMAAAELIGLHNAGVTGTIKHFCGNNQETNRHFLDSVISERALREIYLKGFEIAVKRGKADSIMTTYGSVNGIWTAGSFDLNTTILREEWGFKGFTMTDWWANINERGGEPTRNNFAAMARAQNDVYMVCADSSDNEDTTAESLENGTLTRAELQRNAKNILTFLLKTNALKRLVGEADTVEIIGRDDSENEESAPVIWYDIDEKLTIDLGGVKSQEGSNYSFALKVSQTGWYNVTITASSEAGELAQIPVTLFLTGSASGTFTWNGTDGKLVSMTKEAPMFSHFTAVRLYFAQNGLDLHSITFELSRPSGNIVSPEEE
ncbi:MAG: glycoside hydrolase family 3 C-terminal domain-containing protein [Ruminococcus flavefaciens]|nr:glycoside hydrolase family 3 C-terminal domain-containing protein [Ruminococcus flavefaciens]